MSTTNYAAARFNTNELRFNCYFSSQLDDITKQSGLTKVTIDAELITDVSLFGYGVPLPCRGYYKGVEEVSWMLENCSILQVKELVRLVTTKYKQESVLVTSTGKGDLFARLVEGIEEDETGIAELQITRLGIAKEVSEKVARREESWNYNRILGTWLIVDWSEGSY